MGLFAYLGSLRGLVGTIYRANLYLINQICYNKHHSY
jgi:hypothetical protein